MEAPISDHGDGPSDERYQAPAISETEVMTRLDKIEQDIAGLSHDELARFREWFEQFEADRFDRTIEDGIKAGELNALADAAL
ncbi:MULTISPECIES: hypothetical protein [unclassified Aureimonas]|uniref:hypothetical protein n=1 Tax=unclassified Aureimonas TaxID=2615206 RepID=UPI0006F83D8E|nr:MULTISPECIES: hypothetical protein [unclassified Aureimonas]KQT52913.1 hypothetical protein ASG62_13450 [Aureimonas sp. Leaf427]KQT80372.1 hypothetical protein ASG54_07300 [Aureimonas sp. Leaf460]